MASSKQSFFKRLSKKSSKAYQYCAHGVWHQERSGMAGKLVKVVNLSVRCIFKKDIQEKACALTFRTILSVVPLLAMLFAIARGFGLENLLNTQLMEYFPAQQEVLQKGTKFVDNYLEHASEGVFVGIGLVMLLYTLVTLLANVENTFNKIWGVTHKRQFYRKLTDYTALLLFIPVFLICSAGLQLFLSEIVQEIFPVSVSPIAHNVLDALPIVLVWLAFTFTYWLIPNTKVKFRYAFIAGVVSGSLFFLFQWIFVAGQIKVSTYNAIYGSFAFLPLLLFWLQISWTIMLVGAVMCFSMQKIFGYNYSHHEDVVNISPAYLDEVSIMSLALIIKRFDEEQMPMQRHEFSGEDYNIPILLVDRIITRLKQAHLIIDVVTEDGIEGYQPAFSPDEMTLGEVRRRLDDIGSSRFIEAADNKFTQAYDIIESAPAATPISQLLGYDSQKP